MDGVGWGSSKGDGSSSGRLCLARRSRDGMQPYMLMCVVGGGDGGGGGGGTSSDKLRHVFHFYTTILLYRFLANAMSSYSRLERVPSGCPECLVDHAGVEDAVGRPNVRNSFSGHAPVVNAQASLELGRNSCGTVSQQLRNCSGRTAEAQLFRNCSATVAQLFQNCPIVAQLFRNCSATLPPRSATEKILRFPGISGKFRKIRHIQENFMIFRKIE